MRNKPCLGGDPEPKWERGMQTYLIGCGCKGEGEFLCPPNPI